jgi:carboxyl-terminal processing protease
MNTAKKLNAWLPLLFALVMVLGMMIGFKLRENTSKQAGFFKLPTNNVLQEVVDLIHQKYVDSLQVDTLVQQTIEEMLKQLDPHSAYIPSSTVNDVAEDLQGNFKGIGVEFNIFNDTVHILNVTEHGPGFKAGLLTGDKIIKVNDTLVAGNGITAPHIRKLLRGLEASKVAVTIMRASALQIVTIARGLIPLPSVDAAYMMNDKLGYMHINKFSETTHKEFVQQLEPLQKKGLQQLIVDLRDNGGGILQEAVEIADEFLEGDKLLLYTKGSGQKRNDYRCKRKGLFEQGKLIILANEGTASASEILMGALQDWDRATIIGRRSFGKGLVQEQYALSDGAALRLTVARYYTPSGRSIQKPYIKGGLGYNEEITERYQHGAMMYADSNHVKNGLAFKTAAGRTVYGGGGIMPDIFVPADTGNTSVELAKLFTKNTMNNFAYRYYMDHRQEFAQTKSPTALYQQQNKPILWAHFSSFAASDSINVNRLGPKDKDFATKRLIALMARQQWRSNGFFEVLNTNDPTIHRAAAEISK